MLKSVNKFLNVLLVSNWKIALIFWFPFQGMLHGQGPKKTGGMEEIEVFIFNFFVNRFDCCFFVQCFTIIIIKCKASFSCHSSSSHYSTQGFVLISFHFIFSFLKYKKKKILCNFTCDLPLSLRISYLKCGQAKNSQANGSLRENVSVFLIAPSCFNKQTKCRYERTFKERNCLD